MQRSAFCRSRRELSNAYLLAKFGFDTAGNEPSKPSKKVSRERPRRFSGDPLLSSQEFPMPRLSPTFPHADPDADLSHQAVDPRNSADHLHQVPCISMCAVFSTLFSRLSVSFRLRQKFDCDESLTDPRDRKTK